MWRGGCIIRSVFLGNIRAAFDKNPELNNLLLDDFFAEAVQRCQVRIASHTCTSIMADTAAALVARGGVGGGAAWHPGARFQHGPVILRRIPLGAPACQPHPGSMHASNDVIISRGVCRRSATTLAHTRTSCWARRVCDACCDSAMLICAYYRQVCPHQLDRARWQHVSLDLQCLTTPSCVAMLTTHARAHILCSTSNMTTSWLRRRHHASAVGAGASTDSAPSSVMQNTMRG